MEGYANLFEGYKFNVLHGYRDKLRGFLIPKLTKIEVLNFGKVMRFTFFTFAPHTQIKTICSDEDVFDPEMACYIAYAKYYDQKLGGVYTSEGIVDLANQMKKEKVYVKLVGKAMKMYPKAVSDYMARKSK